MKKVLLYFGDTSLDPKKVIEYLDSVSIPYTIVSDKNANDIIGNLLDRENKVIETSSAFSFNFMLYAGMNKEEVFKNIQTMQSLNLHFSHKAMLTENNIKWNLQALLEEMVEEHTFMLSYNKLQSLLKEANSLNYEEYEEESFIKYRDAFLKAYMYIKQNKPELNILNELNENIIKTRNALKKK